LSIADHFKWSLSEIKNLSVFEMKQISKYFKAMESKHKAAERKAKMRTRRHR